ncbi:MAG: hypothetical protein JWO33_511 [Caulobacteraceae bacterium]|nr:hypothetical protein [Caulobacteraceae bacterium]
MRARTSRRPWRAWAGLVAAPAAWASHHQLGSDLNFSDCQSGDGGVAIAIGVAALAVAVTGGWLSWSAWRTSGGPADTPGRLVASLSLMASALFSMVIGIQMLAAVIVPACFR